MKQYITNLFSGNSTSTQHFANALDHTQNAATNIKDATVNTAKITNNLTATGAQTILAYALHEGVAGKIIANNTGIQLTAAISQYAAPTLFSTKALGLVATTSDVVSKLLVTHPLIALSTTAGMYILMNPHYASEAFKNVGLTCVNIAEAGTELFAAAGEASIGTILLMKEGAQLVQDQFDQQNGLGVNSDHSYVSITIRENCETSLPQNDDLHDEWMLIDSTDPQLIDDWVLVNGVDSSLINEG